MHTTDRWMDQGAYKFGKMKFPKFSGPSKQLFPDHHKEKSG